MKSQNEVIERATLLNINGKYDNLFHIVHNIARRESSIGDGKLQKLKVATTERTILIRDKKSII